MGKKLQWAGKSLEQWHAVGVETPGERLPVVSFATGVVSTTVTRFLGFWAAGRVFAWRGTEMPIGFVFGAVALLLLNDVVRVRRFLGNSGVWTELGYAAGGLIGVGIYLFY
jgi:hypothetical protein